MLDRDLEVKIAFPSRSVFCHKATKQASIIEFGAVTWPGIVTVTGKEGDICAMLLDLGKQNVTGKTPHRQMGQCCSDHSLSFSSSLSYPDKDTL